MESRIFFKVTVFILLGISFMTCRTIREPWKRSFKYYDKNFQLPANTKLKTSGSYLLVTDTIFKNGEKRPICDFLVFREDGLVKLCVTFCDVEYAFLSNECNDIFGYYKIRGDSIYFTTKSFYRHTPNYYSGVIEDTFLRLTLNIGNTDKYFTDEYRFCDYRFPCSDQDLW